MKYLRFTNINLACRLISLLAALLLASGVVSATHNPVWTAVGSFGGLGEDGIGAAKTDADGNLYVTGFFSATANFQNRTLISYGDADMYLAKFGPHGHLLWIVQVGGFGLDEGTDLAFDAKGNVFVTGWFSDSAIFKSANGQSTIVNGYVHENIFLAKYSPAGKLLWLRRGGNPVFYDGNNRAWGIAVNPKTGSVYLTGYAEGTTLFSTSVGPDQPVPGPDWWHMYLVKYDAQGNFRWGETDTGEGNTIAYKVAADKNDDAYVVGWFEFGATFSSRDGNSQFVNGFSTPNYPDYADDAFLVKYDGNGNLKWINHAGGYKAIANNLALRNDGKITITGLVGNISWGTPSQAETIITSQPSGTTVSLGSGKLTYPYNWDIFLATYNTFGTLTYHRRIGDAKRDFGAGLSYDLEGNLYVTGFFGGRVDFGGLALNGTALNNVFVAKYDRRGHLTWAKTVPGAGCPDCYQETGPRVWVDEGHARQGRGRTLIVSGPYSGSASFGSYTITSVGADDIYVMKLNQ